MEKSNYITIINHPHYKGYTGFFLYKINNTQDSYVRIDADNNIVIMKMENILFDLKKLFN